MRRDTGAQNEIRQIGRLASRGEFLMRRFFTPFFGVFQRVHLLMR